MGLWSGRHHLNLPTFFPWSWADLIMDLAPVGTCPNALTKKVLTCKCEEMVRDACITLSLAPRFTQIGVALTINQNDPSFIFGVAKYSMMRCRCMHACLWSNVKCNDYKCCDFSLSCSILLNAYDTSAKRAEWLWNTGGISEQEKWGCMFMSNGNKKCKGHNTRGRDINH